MKLLFSAILALCFAFGASGQRAADRDFEGLKGKVKSVEYWYQDLDEQGKRIYSNKRHTVDEYDTAGNLVKSTYDTGGERRTYFLLDGKRVWKSEFFDGPHVAKLITVTPPAGTPAPPAEKKPSTPYDGRFGYRYDSAGRIEVLEKYMDGDKLHSFRTFTYDSQGRIASDTETRDGRKSHGDRYTYDSDGVIVSRLADLYLMSGEPEVTLFSYSKIKVDKHGNWTQRTVKQGEGKDAQFVAIESRKISYH